MDYKYCMGVTDDFKMLSDELNTELQEQFGKKQEIYQQYNLLDGIKDVIICYDGCIPIGCASMKYFDDESYEIKRVFIKKKYRGRGLSKRMLQELESIAKERKIVKLILETGKSLEPAIGLYRDIGYKVIENYGQYKDLSESVCMEKIL